MCTCNVFFLILYSSFLFNFASSAINLYIPSNEVKRVLGFDAEYFFIRRGEEKLNAINHEILMTETISHIKFRWQDERQLSSPHLPPLYNARMYSNDSKNLQTINTDLPPQGQVPIEEKEFEVNITCNPKLVNGGSAYVYLELKFTGIIERANNETLLLKFTFFKLCVKHSDLQIVEQLNNPSDETPAILNSNNNWSNNKERKSINNNKDTFSYILFGVFSTVILIAATCIGFLHSHSMPKELSEEHNEDNNLLPQQNESISSNVPKVVKYAIAEKQQREILYHLKDFVIRKNLLILGNTVQEGSFGRACMATLINADSGEEFKVLVKSVTDQASPEQVTLFLLESSMLKRTTHHNVLPLMHVCYEENFPPLIIFPYMNRGNLKNYLRLTRTAEPLSKPLTTRDIVLMAIQIARGLQYLARRRLVHKDVATRSCVVDEELHVKIADNALARDFFPGDYHCLGDNETKPIRWMACECLENNVFLVASDVWSYGVLLWELSTLAQTPYANVDPFEMLTYLKSGLRLPQPSYCPDDLFTVMACCWALSPEERPHFAQIIACLEAFINKLNAYI